MHIFCVDDDDFHREKIINVVRKALVLKGVSDCEVVGCVDGDDFLNKVQGTTPAFVTMDINMPNKDGLSALIRYKHLAPSVPVIMASSENDKVVKRLSTDRHFSADPEKKEQLLSKVIERVRNDQMEEGKLNSVLEAVANLGMDPMTVAKNNGAKGFLKKPFEEDKTAEILTRFL
ncbi:MAG: response regulator [Pseudomonadales bacterium]|nr:response regulator [Pseudomonadales bacterium]